ncbi:hypothetical protein [Nocardiopsis coralliicola]
MRRPVRIGERGASTAEYAAVVLLIAAVIGAIMAFGLPTDVRNLYAEGLCRIDTQNPECDDQGEGGSASPSPDDGSGEEGGEGDPGDEEGSDGESPEDVSPADAEGVFDPELAADYEAAQDELDEAEAALADAGFDEAKEALLELLGDIIGYNDAKACITEGDIMACLWTVVGFTPWGKGAKLVKNTPAIVKLWNRFRRTKKARETAENAATTARGKVDDAVTACTTKRPRNRVAPTATGTDTADFSIRPSFTEGSSAGRGPEALVVFLPADDKNPVGGTPCDRGNDFDPDDEYFKQDLEEASALMAGHSDRMSELGFTSKKDFQEYLERTMDPRNSSTKDSKITKQPSLKNGRIAWYDSEKGVIIIHNPDMPTRSTVYKGSFDEFLRLS